jgi:hypothetical protein
MNAQNPNDQNGKVPTPRRLPLGLGDLIIHSDFWFRVSGLIPSPRQNKKGPQT